MSEFRAYMSENAVVVEGAAVQGVLIDKFAIDNSLAQVQLGAQGVEVAGYFTAPSSGEYSFMVQGSGDISVELQLPGSDAMTEIASGSGLPDTYYSYYLQDNQRSAAYQLPADTPLRFRARQTVSSRSMDKNLLGCYRNTNAQISYRRFRATTSWSSCMGRARSATKKLFGIQFIDVSIDGRGPTMHCIELETEHSALALLPTSECLSIAPRFSARYPNGYYGDGDENRLAVYGAPIALQVALRAHNPTNTPAYSFGELSKG
jgi:hypothetical protein